MDGGRVALKSDKNHIVMDFETSDSRVNYGQILEAGVVLTDPSLRIIEKLPPFRCRLKSTIVPSIGSLLVNNISIRQLQSSNLSHYQMVFELYNTFKKFSLHGAYFTGFNSVSFDLEFYRRTLWKALIPEVYQTNTKN